MVMIVQTENNIAIIVLIVQNSDSDAVSVYLKKHKPLITRFIG